uniref:TNFAIP3-interacting protein 1-like n=1 Tax=Gasterosteus aculeatus aculeatus TaxID=481459 RepID=UPI001A988663|nr:TNFAIP3-interacting protein 1-like [Gasterosteus aculeatus aculeatus]
MRLSMSGRSSNMSQNENPADGPPVERSRTTYQRLYPSLPDTDRFNVCEAAEKLHTAAVNPPGRTPQSQASAGGMKAQMLLLEEQKQELLSINTKWAKEYRTMARYYKARIQHLNELLQRGHSGEEMCEEGGNNHKENTEDKLLKEAEGLRAQNSTLTQKGQRQQDEIRRLNKALEEALKTTQPLSVSSETLQDVWKHQADVYKEDFLKERSDREKLMEKHLKQEKQFRKVHSELCALKSQLRSPQPVLAACPHREVRLQGGLPLHSKP